MSSDAPCGWDPPARPDPGAHPDHGEAWRLEDPRRSGPEYRYGRYWTFDDPTDLLLDRLEQRHR